jgi:adenine/guanine phosphoribosyltransferase-like PRPP-binding protein
LITEYKEAVNQTFEKLDLKAEMMSIEGENCIIIDDK